MATIRKRELKKRDGTPSGGVAWQVDFTDHTGKRRMRQFKSRKEAKAFLEDALALKRDGRYVHAPSSVTVADAAAQWERHLEARVRGGMRMEDGTRGDYVGKTHLHILPFLGSLRLSNLTSATVHGLKDDLLALGRSPATTRKVLGVLVQLLRFCVERGMLPTNPALGVRVELSNRDRRRVRVPSREDVRRLLDLADDSFRPMLVVSTFCGLRSGELRGLRWQDVDLQEAWLEVHQRADSKGNLGPPKSAAGRRRIPIGPTVCNALKRWRLKGPARRGGLVFPSATGRPMLHSNLLHRHWFPLRTQAGLDNVRWHDLRHFAVSLWIAQNLQPRVVMQYAGHSGIQITMDLYGHLFPDDAHHDQMAAAELSVIQAK